MAEGFDAFQPGILSQKKKFEKVLSGKGIKALYTSLEAWKQTLINIAVVGEKESGKTTFIRQLLGLEEDEDEEEVNERGNGNDTQVESFRSDENPNVIFWDFPGFGAKGFSRDAYLKTYDLEKYDYVFIISQGRFKEDDVWLAKHTEKIKKQFYFIRTHIEYDLENDQETHPVSHDRNKVLTEIREYCLENIRKAKLSCEDVFLIDSYEREMHDFPRLYKKIISDVGGIHSCVMASCIAPMTETVINQKATVLQSRIEDVDKVVRNYLKRNEIKKAKQVFINECNLYRKSFNIDIPTICQIVHDNQKLQNIWKEDISNELINAFEKTEESAKLVEFQADLSTSVNVFLKPVLGISVCLGVSPILLQLLNDLKTIAIEVHTKMIKETVQNI